MPDDINLPNLVSHLSVDLEGLSGTVADAQRQGSSIGAALGAGVQRELRDLVSHLPEIEIDGNSTDLDRDLARVRREMDELANQRIGVDISIEDALRRINELQPHLDRLSDQHPNINVQAATRGASRQLDELLAAARRVDDTDVEVDVHVNEDHISRAHGLLGKLTSGLGSLAGIGAGIGKAAVGIGSIAPALGSAVSMLTQVAPAGAVAVTGLAAVQLASGTVKLAAVGMGDALSAALDPSKAADYSEALKKLSPEARKFAGAIHDAAPQLRALQQSVQDQVFKGLGDQLERTGKDVLPVLKFNLLESGAALNTMASGVLTAARGLAKDGTLGQALGSASQGLNNLAGVPGVVVKSLGQIAAAAGPSFERLTEGAGDAATRIGEKLSKAFESGAMQKAIEHAIDLIKQLAEVGGNVVTIIGNVFNAMPPGGGGMVSVLQDVSAALASITASPEVQSGLRSIFETMAVIGKTVAPLLAQALSAVAPVFTALGPPVQTLVTALGEGLSPIITALGPVLASAATAVGALVTAAAPLLPVVGQLAASLLPALTPLLDAARVVFEAMAPVVAQVATILQDTLAPIIAQLPALIAPLADMLAQNLATQFQLIGQLLTQVGPSLVQLGVACGQLLVALTPVITAMAQFATEMLTHAGPALGPLISLVASLASIMIGGLAQAITGVAVPALRALSALLSGNVNGAVSAAKAAFSGLVASAVGQFTALPNRAIAALSPLAGRLAASASSAGQSLVSSVRAKVDSAVATVRGLPGLASGALGGLGGVLRGAGASLISGFISGIQSQIGSVRSTLQGLTSKLTDWKGPKKRDATILTPAGRLLIQGLIKGITATTPSLRATLQKTTKDLATWAADGLMKAIAGTTKQMQAALAKLAALAQKAYGTNMAAVIAKDQAKLESLARRREALVKRLNRTSGGKAKSALRSEIADLDRQRDAIKKEMANARQVQKAGAAVQAAIARGTLKLNALAKKRDAVVKKLTGAQKMLDSLTKSRSKVAGDITSGILQEANITTGHADVNSVSAITVELQQALKKTKEFQDNIAKLRAAGLRGDLLQQIADAGVEGGAATAAALARATPAELTQINDLQGQLATSAKKTGDLVGDALYGAGIRAAQGLVAGLKSQEKSIEKSMAKIAGNMLKTTKKVHKTHSPSRAFAEIGAMDMEGLRGGVLGSAHRAIGAVSDVAGRALRAASGVGGALTAAVPTGGQLAAVYAGAGAAGGGDNHFHMYGGDATPGGILRALSWQGLVGRR
ncbi:phage tail protein [Streptomyces sp. NPDC001781]